MEDGPILLGASERQWYQDLNSTGIMWVRWLLLLNLFTSILIGLAIAKKTPEAMIISYSIAMIPAMLFLFSENVVYCASNNRRDIYDTSIAALRTTALFITVLMLILWLASFNFVFLLVLPWFLITVTLIFENYHLCQVYDRCCNCWRALI